MTSAAVADNENRHMATEHTLHQPPSQPQHQPAQPYVSSYVVSVTEATEHERLPCCGIGIGWLLFILGFLCAIPWYIGFFILLFTRKPLEKPGYIACAIGAFITTIFILIGATGGSWVWS